VLDAKLLLGHALGLSSLDMAVRENDAVSAAQQDLVHSLISRRLTGESVARIVGSREFYGLPFTLNSGTLEPRPETELLVDMAIAQLPKAGRFVDLGTGTGCIPIAILANRVDSTAIGIDLNPLALEAAHRNAILNGVANRVQYLEGSWFAPIDGDQRFDLIISNPPYITSAVVETLRPEVKDFDPRLALDGGADGLEPYRVISKQAEHWLGPQGRILFEIGYDQGPAVVRLLRNAGFVNISVHKDLNLLDRVVTAQKSGPNTPPVG
jgi:release factor glutamine methyltransferase